MFNFNVYTTIPTEYLETMLEAAKALGCDKAQQYAIEDELYRRSVQPVECGYCKGGADENVTYCPVCEGSGVEPA